MKKLSLALCILLSLFAVGCDDRDTIVLESPTGPGGDIVLTIITVDSRAEAVRQGLSTVDIEITSQHRVTPYERANDYTLELLGADNGVLETITKLFPPVEDDRPVVDTFSDLTPGVLYEIRVTVSARSGDDLNASIISRTETVRVQT